MTALHRGLPVSHLTDFIGREAELQQLRTLVSSRRLVTITGEAGVGKSRMAARLADLLRRSLGGSTVLIEMTDRDAGGVGEALARAFGASGTSADDIVRALGDRPHLVVLDDLDDASASAPLLEEVLRNTSETRVVVTSRGRTGIGGETVFVLTPLDLPAVNPQPGASGDASQSAACTLLLQRIDDVDPGFDAASALADDLFAVCRATDGLPRFVEAGALAVSILGLREAAVAVTEDPTLLDTFVTHGRADVSSRAVMTAALTGVSQPAIDLMRRLAILESGADLHFAADLFTEGRVDRIAAPAAELVERSLVRSETVGGVRRLRVPLHYRHHVLASWSAEDRSTAERRVHASLRDQLSRTAAAWFSDDQLVGIQLLNRHAADITSLLGSMAADPADAHEALEIISSLRYYWQLHPVDPWPRARDWIETALEVDETTDVVTLRAMLTDAYIAFHEGDLHGARAQLAAIEGIRAADLADFSEQIFRVFVNALVSFAEGDLVSAEGLFSRVLRDSRAADVRDHLGEKYWYLAACQIAAGKQDAAHTTLAEGLAYCDTVGDSWGRAYMWCLLALLAERTGSHADAVQRLRESIETMAEFGDRVGLALCIQLLTAFLARHGEDRGVAQLTVLVPRGPLARPPVPLPELGAAGTSPFRPVALPPDDLSLSEMLSRIIDGEKPRAAAPRADTSTVLSARESEIAALVAEGLGNPAIAARLVLSRRTVEGHVRRILAKLGFRSRSQVAVWAAQHGGGSPSTRG